jgi:Sulfotransferase family
MRPVFILGSERSGSTWLANIFDAHPDVELLMEPFADYAGLFPGFPNRYEYVDSAGNHWTGPLRRTYQGIPAKKYPLFYRPGRSPSIIALDRLIVRSYQALRGRLRIPPSRMALRYDLLNLNKRELPVSRLTPKRPGAPMLVTKELRLNFKVAVLASAFPDAFCLVPIRDPGAQIDSIRKLIQRGNLQELSSSLRYFKDALQRHERFRAYWPLLDEMTQEELLPLWWFINYQTLLEDLARYAVEHETVFHEELSEDPAATTAVLLGRCGLRYENSVSEYVAWSSQVERADPRPTETTRRSGESYRRAIQGVPADLYEQIRSVSAKVSELVRLDPRLARYEVGLNGKRG